MALITYLTRIQFDFGAIKLLPDELKLLERQAAADRDRQGGRRRRPRRSACEARWA